MNGKRTNEYRAINHMAGMVCTIILLLASAAQAADYIWSGRGGDGNWSRATNWNQTVAYPNGPSDTAMCSTNPGNKIPNFDVGVEFSTLSITGSLGWAISAATSAIVTNDGAVIHASSNTSTFAPLLTGAGSVIVSNGTFTITCSTNTYTGKTIISGGIMKMPGNVLSNTSYFGSPSAGNEEILFGDTTGTNSAMLDQPNGGGAAYFSRPIRVRAGSTGPAILSTSGNTTLTFSNAVTFEKDLTLQVGASAQTFFAPLTMFGSGSPALIVKNSGAGSAVYMNTNNPTHTGGTRVSGAIANNTGLQWTYTNTPPAGTVLRFGSNTNNGPGTITLDGGVFNLYYFLPASANGQLTLESPFVVTTNNGSILTDNQTSPVKNFDAYFTGPILLGGRLTLGNNWYNGSSAVVAHHQGTISIDQSAGAPCALSYTQWKATVAEDGKVMDGPGMAKNSLILDAGITLVLTNTYTHANGTFIEGDTTGLFDVKPVNSSSFGLGDIWLPEGARVRLAQLSNVASGAKVGLWANQSASSLLVVTTNFVPALRSDAAGVLAADCANFNAVTNMALLGGGQMFLGSYGGGTFVGTTLSPASDGIYRLGAGGNTLTINNGVLTGATCSVQAGLPGGNINGTGTAKLLAANTYSGSSIINLGSTLEGTAQASGTPFGSTTAGVTINGGTLRLDGIATANVTNTVGTVTANGLATLTMNQGNAQTNGLIVSGFSTRNQAMPYIVNLSGAALANLGGKERIVITNNPPVPVNNMVSPIYQGVYGTVGDFVTYNSASDAIGPIGFKSAAGNYVAVNSAASLAGVGASGIANVTGAFTPTADASVYAMKVAANINNDVSTHTITIGSGGLIQGASGVAIGSSNNLNFGSSEAIIFANTYQPKKSS